MSWVDVKERLPSGEIAARWACYSPRVVVSNGGVNVIAVLDRDDDNWYVGNPADRNIIEGVTHWKPIPKWNPRRNK